MIKEKEDLLTYELILKDDEDEVFALSLVDEPAIQQDFVWFSKNGKEEVKFADVDTSQRTICGPILIPDMKIVRVDETGIPYYVTFSKETVKQIAEKYIKDNNANNMTLQHQKPIKGVSLVQSWIADSHQYDKARNYGLRVKPGTWFGIFKVENEDIWQNWVKTGKVAGISLEGLFTHQLIQASKVDLMDLPIEMLSESEAEIVLNKIEDAITKLSVGLAGEKISFDFDDTLSTERGQTLAKELLDKGYDLYVISARGNKEGILPIAEKLGISSNKVFATGSNGEKVNKIKELGITKHYDNNSDVIKELGNIGVQFEGINPSIPNSSYPGEVSKKKKDYIHPALLGLKK